MPLYLRIFFIVLSIATLTLITQIGGIVLLIALIIFPLINKKLGSAWKRLLAKVTLFIALYLSVTFLIVPPVAKIYGRVPLPLFETSYVKPVNVLTCVLNRNYVRPALRNALFNIASELDGTWPGAKVNYLDANFPFINGFPLFPHLSHNDGKKLDLSFQYNDIHGEITNETPSFIGYGICEEPQPTEEDRPRYCSDKGYWQYSFLKQVVPQLNKAKFKFDEPRTKQIISALAVHPDIGKIFIEPHLKSRLNLTHSKIRFHGCQAVRHDDHIHVQLK